MDLQYGLKKIITIFNDEKIPYMIVGGFATSFYNQYRFTADIDCVLQIYPNHIEKIVIGIVIVSTLPVIIKLFKKTPKQEV